MMSYKKLKLGSALVLLLCTVHAATVQADEGTEPMPGSKEKQLDCIPVSIIEPTKFKPRSFVIQSPGRYCLMEDLTFSYNPLNPFWFLLSAEARGAFGDLSPGVELDLGGHTLRSNYGSVNGLSAPGGTPNFPRTSIIKNGKIDVKSDAIFIRSSDTDHYEYDHERKPPKKDKVLEYVHSQMPYIFERDGFLDSNLILDNLDINVTENAIILVGNNNIIRNCKIRVRGSNAITLFGRNVKILNNEIIVESELDYGGGKTVERDGKTRDKIAKPSMAPIMIRDGDNALISGNKITINGDEANRPAQAISLRDSRNVRIENNQFIGVQAIYKAFETFNVESTATESNNSLKTKAGWFD